jgi:hypothetical protein
MALDFAVLTEDETAADIVSLEWRQHDVLVALAEQLKLTQLLRIEDYFEEVDWAPEQLPALSEELGIVRNSAAPDEIIRFAGDLDALIALAVRRKQRLSAIPD